jgi:hypothetical protein
MASRRDPKPPRRREPPAHKAGRADAASARAARPTVDPVVPDDPAAARIVTASYLGTGLLAVTATLGAIAPDPFAPLAVGSALLLFAAGLVTFAWAYAVAVGRSRTDLIGMGGLFFLAGSAPRSVQRSLAGSLVAQVVVAIATASVWLVASDHFEKATVNPLAFGLLAPMYGLGLMGLWGAKFGTFPPRPPDPERKARRPSEPASGS